VSPVRYELGFYNSVFVFSLRAAFDCVFNLKTLKTLKKREQQLPQSTI
jgi:hypothetical protein